ncbi:MAG: hypothetical protein QF906_00710 [Dehalococcoidales bacterium]|nr:hypothetical protein [Dehalococcoidales bacterium]MDP7286276.1 hypothetical protein [Dehalococcoidales bacterium]MDP7415360.1 hypothetical protein [Dehalococcoidales bacterium]
MTNTLHRFGKPDELKDDYIAFTLVCPGKNDMGSIEKARDFLKIALKYNPVNFAAESRHGPVFRPEKNLNLFRLYLRGRKEIVSPELVMDEMEPPAHAVVVFDKKQALEEFLKEIKEIDLGLSVNVSSLVEDFKEIAQRIGISPHSINYSLGFRGNLYRLPEQQVLALTTMCGHGLIASSFAKKMIDRVKERRLAPEKAARYMAKLCVCGAFNTSRAERILHEARMSKSKA